MINALVFAYTALAFMIVVLVLWDVYTVFPAPDGVGVVVCAGQEDDFVARLPRGAVGGLVHGSLDGAGVVGRAGCVRRARGRGVVCRGAGRRSGGHERQRQCGMQNAECGTAGAGCWFSHGGLLLPF